MKSLVRTPPTAWFNEKSKCHYHSQESCLYTRLINNNNSCSNNNHNNNNSKSNIDSCYYYFRH